MSAPHVLVGGRRLSEMTRDALAVLRHANDGAPRLFQRGGILVRLRLDDEVPGEALTPDALRGELDRAAQWVNRWGEIMLPPIPIVRDTLSVPSYDNIPCLRAVAEAPFFARDGRLVATTGYDLDTGVFLRLPPGLAVPDVPEVPSAEDLARARALLADDLLVDFPFVDQASRAHAIALFVAPFVRRMIDGPLPLHAIDAPMPRTGKGLLADVAALVVTGRPVEVMTEVKDSEELRKRITALLLAGGPYGPSTTSPAGSTPACWRRSLRRACGETGFSVSRAWSGSRTRPYGS